MKCRVPPGLWGHYKNFCGLGISLIESILYFFIILIVFLFILGLVWNGTPFAFIFIFAAAVLAILLGAGIYSEGIRDDSKPAIDIVTVDNSMTTIDFNSSRASYRTVANDPVVAMLAPVFMYGGVMGLIFAGIFIFRAVRLK